MYNFIDAFWRRHPALLLGSAVLLGCGSSLGWHHNWFFFVPFLILWGPLLFASFLSYPLAGRIILAFFIACAASAYSSTRYEFPSINSEGIKGTALLKLSSLSSNQFHFGRYWIYKGIIPRFDPDETNEPCLHNIACSVSIPNKPEVVRPSADQAYQIHGTLKQTSNGYSLVPDKDKPWIAYSDLWSPAEWGYKARQAVSSYIHQKIKNKQSGDFLSGIATGNFEDRLTCHAFSRFGLQHIMAISGFHFALLASFLGFFFSCVMPRKIVPWILIVLLTCYCVFLGATPSILRAWLTAMVVLIGTLFDKKSSGLNSLGAALIFTALYDPLFLQGIGFQFSFITTASILVFFSPFDKMLCAIFPKRRLSQAIEMNARNQHGYLLLTFCRQAVALAFAVNLTALPMTLYYFHKFPLLSLIYNLFFPFMVSLAILLLLLGLLFSFIPPLSEAIHGLNNIYTQFMLNFTQNMPGTLDISWHSKGISAGMLTLYLCLIFCFGVWWHYHLNNGDGETRTWEYL